jgi:hypothetical protein
MDFVLIEPELGSGVSGGGGIRTRVPRHFHASFYVHSRFFGFSKL